MNIQYIFLICSVTIVTAKFDLQIVHVNDFHARFDPINPEFSSKCLKGEENTCIGGVSRIFKLSHKLLSTSKNTLFLNAGDNYQGSLWYTLFKWNVTAEFLGHLPFDAFVPGNHDFDDGIAGIVPFLERLPYPTIGANIDTRKEPRIAKYIKPSVIIKRGGKKIGIIGYVLKSFPNICKTEKLKFSDEAKAVIKESKRLKAKGVDILIALSHAGILKDIEVAKKAGLIDIIVGGHSHTFMYSGESPNPYEKPEYPYPLVVKQKHGRKVLIVQAAAFSKYIGNLTVTFDNKGEVVSYGGNPILLDHKVPTDKHIDKELKPWRKRADEKGNVVMGKSLVELEEKGCYVRECSLGNFMCDSMVYNHLNSPHKSSEWTSAVIGVFNSGGLRTTILKGDVTYANVLDVIPFAETIDSLFLKGSTIRDIIELGVTSKRFLQWSGIDVTIDPHQKKGKIVKDLKILCTKCKVPKFEPVVLHKYYQVITNSFLAKGGDGFDLFTKYGVNHTEGLLDTEVFFSYLKRSSPVTTGVNERVRLVHPISNGRKHTLTFA